MRFLLRVASVLALVIGVLVASIDAIQSVAASQPTLTSVGTAVAASSGGGMELVRSLEGPQSASKVWSALARWILVQPAFAMLLLVSLLFWMMGYRRAPVAGRFSA